MAPHFIPVAALEGKPALREFTKYEKWYEVGKLGVVVKM